MKKKIEKLTKIPINHGEKIQFVHYPIEGHFKAHTDFGSGIINTRRITFMIYLNDVPEGGETLFPDLGFAAIPTKGRALVWYNCKEMQLPSSKTKERFIKIPKKLNHHLGTLHQANPVRKGDKLIVTKWIHDRVFTYPEQ